MHYFIGDRIALAVYKAWEVDGFEGRLDAVVVIFSVTTTIVTGAVAIINLFV